MNKAALAEAFRTPASAPIQSIPAPSRKVIARYPIATIGSRTVRGGEVVLASNDQVADDYRIACVGDRVRYPDGSESVITSGAGHASTIANRPIALVGSHVANGDRIVARAQSMGEIVVLEGEPVAGLLEPGYMPPSAGGLI
ncbi:MAG: PAAR domain-containing protein [Telluria sp.]